MESPKAYIFDLDGTLADTLDGIVHSLNATLSDFDLPTHPREAYRAFIGDGVLKLVERALPPNHEQMVPDILAAYVPRLESEGGSMATAFDGADEVLATLQNQGIPAAVLSNKPHDAAVDVVQRLFPKYPFVAVQGAGDVFPLKPDPAAGRHIASLMDIPPRLCAYVGDSDVDMITARNCGMLGIGAAYGIRGESELRQAGADIIIQQPTDLLTYIQAK